MDNQTVVEEPVEECLLSQSDETQVINAYLDDMTEEEWFHRYDFDMDCSMFYA